MSPFTKVACGVTGVVFYECYIQHKIGHLDLLREGFRRITYYKDHVPEDQMWKIRKPGNPETYYAGANWGFVTINEAKFLDNDLKDKIKKNERFSLIYQFKRHLKPSE